MKKVIQILLSFTLLNTAYSASIFSDSEITNHFQQTTITSSLILNNREWDELLDKYIETVDGVNLFNYGLVNSDDKAALDNYVEYLQGVTATKLNEKEQFAYWVNFYNALTVQIILNHYPVESITEISYGLLTYGPWKQELVEVEGLELSLDDIEHKILRPIFNDNRIHYAVNCASIGCPNLQTEAFKVANLDMLLDQGAKQYINHPRGVSVVNGELQLSSIFDWYAEDFGNNDAEIISHLLKFSDPPLKEKLSGLSEIESYHYDWALNE